MSHTNPSSPFLTAIIGAGFGGLGAGIRLRQAGRGPFVIFERANDLGGTWRDNTYPGCGCDVPSHLYSYSFDLNPSWSRTYSRQPEILEYLRNCAKKHNLYPHIRFNTAIRHLVFDEIKGLWKLIDQHGQTTLAQTVIMAIGPLNVPVFPKINGRENFGGVNFHSSQWDHHFDPTGKRVAVVGTGASAIQIVPAIAPEVSQLFVFQRTAPWIIPKNDRAYPEMARWLFKRAPLTQWILRELIYWLMELRGKGLFGSGVFARLGRAMALRHIRKSISDPALRQKVTPLYPMGCKRVLPSDDYYPALQRPNVELVTEPIAAIEEKGLLGKQGSRWEVDAIIYATGFEAAEFKNRGLTVIGREGRNLFEEWADTSAEAYLGTTVSGYPGLLLILGPNSGLGHNSVVHIMESQLNYILDYLKKKPASGYLDVKAAVQQSFNKKIQEALAQTVWANPCTSWYKTPSGKNTTLWPGHTTRFRKLTRQVNLEDYEIRN